jgi:hypothetical protein
MHRLALVVGFALVAGRSVRAAEIPDVTFPGLTDKARSAEGFVPKGWKLESQDKGDLNGDHRADLLLVLRQTDPRNIVKNEPDGLGPPELDTNPRILVVAFAEPTGGYRLVLQNQALIPRHVDFILDDPLAGVSIRRGTFRVALSFFASAGTWSMSSTTYTFRYQNSCFQLIGYDQTETQRNTGETTSVSINYSTRQGERRAGTIDSDKMRVRKSRLPPGTPACIDKMGDDPSSSESDERESQ